MRAIVARIVTGTPPFFGFGIDWAPWFHAYTHTDTCAYSIARAIYQAAGGGMALWRLAGVGALSRSRGQLIEKNLCVVHLRKRTTLNPYSFLTVFSISLFYNFRGPIFTQKLFGLRVTGMLKEKSSF
jgi:hypothetical protein